MKTNMPFDEAWRELQNARRGEDIVDLIGAIDRLRHAAWMMYHDQKAQTNEVKIPEVKP